MTAADLDLLEVPKSPEPLRPPVRARTPLEWLRDNLFSSVGNTIVTILCLAFLAWALPPLIDWLFIDAVWTGEDRRACLVPDAGACWAFVKAKLGQFIYGRYPLDQRWRVDLAAVLLVAGLVPLAIPRVPYKRQTAIYLFVIYPLVAFALLYGVPFLGLPEVETALWGGFMLTMVVALVGMATSLPLGIALALGRRSKLPVVRILCTVFIEFVRGVPLITVLYMASLMLPFFLPPGATIDKLLRALVGVALFASAYMAEVVRGGLQAVPRGQYEGAMALGLTPWQMQRKIVLPQALRLVIPGIVNSYIALFKDTSLVLIIGLFDLLGIIQLNFTDPDWATAETPATGYVFAGAVYWVFCFGMSRYSQWMERHLRVGQRR
jgi:general L-amino acid transport system permease protein